MLSCSMKEFTDTTHANFLANKELLFAIGDDMNHVLNSLTAITSFD